MVASSQAKGSKRVGSLVRTRLELREADGLGARADPERHGVRALDCVPPWMEGLKLTGHVQRTG
jgi:hypothetical protein